MTSANPVARGTRQADGKVRYIALDGLRGLLMSWGIVTHVSTLGGSSFYDGTAWISGLFRMATFFVISGFLSAMLCEKYGTAQTVRKRLVSIGVPFLFGLLILNPPGIYLVYIYKNPYLSFTDFLCGKATGTNGQLIWHLHLWFLGTLLIYSLLTPVLDAAAKAVAKTVETGPSRLRPAAIFSLLCGVVIAASFGGRVLFEVVLDAHISSNWRYLCRATITNLPFFFVGMLCFKSKILNNAFNRGNYVHFACSIAVALLSWKAEGVTSKIVSESLHALSSPFLALCSASFLFHLFSNVLPSFDRFYRGASESAYTVYLFHYLCIYGLANLLKGHLGQGFFSQSLIALSTLAITLGIHFLIIEKVPLLRFMFNGKQKIRPAPEKADLTQTQAREHCS